MISYEQMEQVFGVTPKVEDAKYMRYKLKKIWYEHVKNRPMIDKMEEEKRRKVWTAAQLRKPEGERTQTPKGGFSPHYTPEEMQIFETPIETLMLDFEKTL